MNEDWTKTEVEIIVDDYFDMLLLELDHQQYNKSAHRQEILPQLNNRSNGSIEFKHQNISAALANMGLPYIKGYKPRGNYQQLLEEQIISYIKANRPKLERDFEHFSNEIAPGKPVNVIDYNTVLDEEPPTSTFTDREPAFRPIKTNYLEKEQNNRKLGEKGEEFVIGFEKVRLIEAGKNGLADKIEWVSKEKGDGLGYDILSKNEDGTDRYIEVKTTKLSKESPIYLSRTEVAFASYNSENFYLYRVFNFDTKPQIFIKKGKYEGFCILKPESYKGYF